MAIRASAPTAAAGSFPVGFIPPPSAGIRGRSCSGTAAQLAGRGNVHGASWPVHQGSPGPVISPGDDGRSLAVRHRSSLHCRRCAPSNLPESRSNVPMPALARDLQNSGTVLRGGIRLESCINDRALGVRPCPGTISPGRWQPPSNTAARSWRARGSPHLTGAWWGPRPATGPQDSLIGRHGPDRSRAIQHL
jgi:hypothetical protein